jgi:hypothetical protein
MKDAVGPFVVHPDDRTARTPQRVLQLDGERAAQGYFGVMGIPLARGREFAGSDPSPEASTGEAPVIIDAGLARRLWGNADPIGRRLQAATDSAVTLRTLVVGRAADPNRSQNRARGNTRGRHQRANAR